MNAYDRSDHSLAFAVEMSNSNFDDEIAGQGIVMIEVSETHRPLHAESPQGNSYDIEFKEMLP